MAKVHVLNVCVLDNPAPFMTKLEFEITFECVEDLPEDLEWKIIYVGSAESEEFDQILDTVYVGPGARGTPQVRFHGRSAQSAQNPRLWRRRSHGYPLNVLLQGTGVYPRWLLRLQRIHRPGNARNAAWKAGFQQITAQHCSGKSARHEIQGQLGKPQPTAAARRDPSGPRSGQSSGDWTDSRDWEAVRHQQRPRSTPSHCWGGRKLSSGRQTHSAQSFAPFQGPHASISRQTIASSAATTQSTQQQQSQLGKLDGSRLCFVNWRITNWRKVFISNSRIHHIFFVLLHVLEFFRQQFLQ